MDLPMVKWPDRDLIDEMCKWGWARLVGNVSYPCFSSAKPLTQNDGRWTGLINGLAIADEIRVFKEKLTAARELLMVFSFISRELQDLTIE
jgi:hypothetical protein